MRFVKRADAFVKRADAFGADAFVAELGRRMAAVTGDLRETAFLRQRLSVAIQRCNAIACRGSIPGVVAPSK